MSTRRGEQQQQQRDDEAAAALGRVLEVGACYGRLARWDRVPTTAIETPNLSPKITPSCCAKLVRVDRRAYIEKPWKIPAHDKIIRYDYYIYLRVMDAIKNGVRQLCWRSRAAEEDALQ